MRAPVAEPEIAVTHCDHKFLTVTQFRTQTSFNAAETRPQGKPAPALWPFVAQTTRRISPEQAAMCARQFLLPATRNLPEV